jgi:hypothetical protein
MTGNTWATVRRGALLSTWMACAMACGSDGGDDGDAADDTTASEGSDGSSSDESGEACVADCMPGGTLLWEQMISLVGDDGATASAVSADGRVAVVGFTNYDFDVDTWDTFVVVYEPDGTIAFEAQTPERARGVAFDADGSVVVGGETDAHELWLRRYAANGLAAWDSVDTGNTGSSSSRLAILPSGDIVIGGGTATAGLLAHYDANGTQLAYTELEVDVYVTSLVALDGAVAVTGVNPDINLFWIARTDPAGAVQWSVNSSGGGWKGAVAVARDGNVVAVTEHASGSSIQVYGPDGEFVIGGDLPRPGVVATDLEVLDDGSIVLAATKATPLRCWIGRMDGPSSVAWERDSTPDAADSECHSIDVAPDGTLVVTGSRRGDTGTADAWIQRLAP